MVDIWDAGVILYAMVIGRLPFAAPSIPAVLQRIRAGEVEYPAALPPLLVDLLRRLLTKDPAERIDIPGIKAHPWLASVSWSYLNESIMRFEHRMSGSTVDPAIVEQLVLHGFDCASLPASLARGEETELAMLYRILSRERVTERMRNCISILKIPGTGSGMHSSQSGVAWTAAIARSGLSSDEASQIRAEPRKEHPSDIQFQAARAVVLMPHAMRIRRARATSPTQAFGRGKIKCTGT
jgi:serine/threonine protein kinase